MSALSQGIGSNKMFEVNRKAAIDRMARRAENVQEMLKHLAIEKIEGRAQSIRWNDLTAPMRCRMHELITSGEVKIYARKTGDYQTEYFVQISDDGLSKVLFDKL